MDMYFGKVLVSFTSEIECILVKWYTMDRISLTFFSIISNGQYVLGKPMDVLQNVQCYTTNFSCSSHFYFGHIISLGYMIYIHLELRFMNQISG